jgi:probable F420-dependent oxidoreductase
MDLGLHLGTRGAAASPEGLTALARRADTTGYAYLGFSDHIVFTRSSTSTYPYSASGAHPVSGSGFCLEQLTCLTYAAAVTNRIRLLTSVMVVPHRPAILAAKVLATADILSKGRVTVGVGTGWLAEEMAALGSPPYDKRGAATNEYIAAFRSLWCDTEPAMDGAYVRIPQGVVFEPKPPQRQGLPIWVGGEGVAARRRAGRLGDGWYPTLRNPREPLDTPQSFATALADVKVHARQAGRDPDNLDVAVFAPGASLGRVLRHRDGRRAVFSGSASEIIEDALAYKATGARHLVVNFEGDDLNEALDRVSAFAEHVMPAIR